MLYFVVAQPLVCFILVKGKNKFSLNNEIFSFFGSLLEKIIVILPIGEKALGFCLGISIDCKSSIMLVD